MQSIDRWSHLYQLGQLGKARTYADRHVLALRSTPANGFWYHAAGLLEVFQPGEEGRSYLARLLCAPTVICLKECLAGESDYLQTVRVLEGAALVYIDRSQTLSILQSHPSLMLRTLVELSRAFCGAARLESNRLHNDENLLAAVLLAYHALCTESDNKTLRIRRTQADLAECIGATERNVNRILSRFKDDRIINKQSGHYVILNQKALEQLVADPKALVHRGAA